MSRFYRRINFTLEQLDGWRKDKGYEYAVNENNGWLFDFVELFEHINQ
jgi:hypothetical protein